MDPRAVKCTNDLKKLGAGKAMEFHISRDARERYGVNDLLFSFDGNVVFANLRTSRDLATKINEVRGTASDPERVIHAGALFAMGLIDELSHVLVDHFRREVDPKVIADAVAWFRRDLGDAAVDQLLQSFTERFPNTPIFRGEETVEGWLDGVTRGMPHREAAFEELLLLWLANVNPAFQPFAELFADAPLRAATAYQQTTADLPEYFATRPKMRGTTETLLDALRAPMLASPDSLSGQLAYIREHWSEFVGEDLRRVLLAIDVLKEEDVAVWRMFHPPSWAEEAARREAERRRRAGLGGEWDGGTYYDGPPDFAASGAVNEYEAFSPDQDWMPTVVLMAKSTYVWLEQLSKKYGQHIHRLDQIPEAELALLEQRGLNGLWLIGIWERSRASERIKHLRGQGDAVASAYSLADYRIADDLGGTAAYEVLRDCAAKYGIRLASDMVPNHMGIDSTWMIEHPEWFLSRPDSPFPSYRFEGPDLSSDPRVEIKLEDHYYDQSDAAVAFRLVDHRTGRTEFVYHGNDGTSFAWNDTAQLDYSKDFVREQVIQTILSVARLFPIIRFDAAMVLAKKHVQRLWFPLPGSGGAIPSRAEYSMTQAEFDGLMPNEFWREVVDRVAVEVPGTLLLAEAFWLLEGYFVRTLGMHRVYNSAFMNMMRDEENAKYRSVIKNTIEFDPDILKRYVNFMSNPDERTAIDQFGTGDKYFGVCTMMATLPGLPMFGHGQIEAFTEKYGMEYKRARYEEWPNEDLVARHQREIAPLLKNRALFAESSNFVLYDFRAGDGAVNENVFAYSNQMGDGRAVVLFNNSYGSTSGSIHVSAATMNKATGELRQRTFSDALELASDGGVLAYRDSATGLEYLRWADDVRDHGFSLDLRGYQYAVLQSWRTLTPSAEQPWNELCASLNGAGVRSVDEALGRMRLRPVHEAFRSLLDARLLEAAVEHSAAATRLAVPAVSAGAAVAITGNEIFGGDALYAEFANRAGRLYTALRETGSLPDAGTAASKKFADRSQAVLRAVVQLPAAEAQAAGGWPAAARTVLPSASPVGTALPVWAAALATGVLRALTDGDTEGATLFHALLLRDLLAESFQALGLEGEASWRSAARVRVGLLTPTAGPDRATPLLGTEAAWKDADVRWLLGVHIADGTEYFNKESFEELAWWAELPAMLQPLQDAGTGAISDRVETALAQADAAGYRADPYVDRYVTKPTAAATGVSGSTAAAPEQKTQAASETAPSPIPVSQVEEVAVIEPVAEQGRESATALPTYVEAAAEVKHALPDVVLRAQHRAKKHD